MAAAHLPLLARSLLAPSVPTLDAVLLPALHSLAASASWAVRRSVAEGLPGVLSALVHLAGGGTGGGQAEGRDGGSLGPGAVAAQGGDGALGAGSLDALGGVESWWREGRGSSGLAQAAAVAAERLLQANAGLLRTAGSSAQEASGQPPQQSSQGGAACQVGVQHSAAVPGPSGACGGHVPSSAGTGPMEGVVWQRCGQLVQMLVATLGTDDVSHWVRSAAVAAAGPALCALPK